MRKKARKSFYRHWERALLKEFQLHCLRLGEKCAREKFFYCVQGENWVIFHKRKAINLVIIIFIKTSHDNASSSPSPFIVLWQIESRSRDDINLLWKMIHACHSDRHEQPAIPPSTLTTSCYNFFSVCETELEKHLSMCVSWTIQSIIFIIYKKITQLLYSMTTQSEKIMTSLPFLLVLSTCCTQYSTFGVIRMYML